MAKFDEMAILDATSQAELVRKKEVKPAELVEAAIERIEAINPLINAIVTPMYEQARSMSVGPLPHGPFTGVPFLLKDLVTSYSGVPMTCGSALLRYYVPDHDSEFVIRLKRTGLIILGKTNTPEFGLLPTTEPLLFGPCRNPWNTSRITGGSSGGSAAAVAAGLVPMAHGNDGGGSIRIPASCCGVFGLKPTRARNPLGPDYGDIMSGLAVEHVITRSVRDSAAMLDATSGPDIGDPYWAPPPMRPFLEEVGADPGRLRIAITSAGPVAMHSDCAAAVKDAAKMCEDLGHNVSEAFPKMDIETVVEAFTTVWAAGCASILDGISRITGQAPSPEQVEPFTWALYKMGNERSASDYLLAQGVLQRATRDIARFFTEYDVWLTPTVARPPVPIGTFDCPKDDPLEVLWRAVAFTPFTPVCNFTGQPGASVPLFWNNEGLPIGTHFIGRFGDEATLFRLAAQLEKARPWLNRRPPLGRK